MTGAPQIFSTSPSWVQALHPLGETAADILRQDWSDTELGAIETWPSALSALVLSTLASPIAAALVLGPRHHLIGNAQTARLLGRSGPTDAVTAFSRIWPAAPQAFERAFAGELFRADGQAFLAPDGELVIADVSLALLHGLDGFPACVQAQIFERNNLRPVEDSSPTHEGFPLISWRAAADGAWVSASSRWTAHTGLGQQESEGFGWLQALRSEDRAPALASWVEAQNRGAFEFDGRIYDRRCDQYRWRRTRGRRRAVDVAGVADWQATSVDIDDLQTTSDKKAVALAESSRRIRNTLGIIRSIARRTAETSETVENFAMHFEGRLDALARVGSLVAGNQCSGVPLDVLIAEELFSFKAREDARLQISGPLVRIKADAAEMLGLAIHELATNALKFGALSLAGGRLEIKWRLLGREPSALLLTWSESGAAVSLDVQQTNGFGGDLLKRGLAYALNARAEFTPQDGGVCWAIELPTTIFTA